MKKVLISGYYGFGNMGDEAILSAMVTSLRADIPNIDITVGSFRPAETEKKYGVKAIPRSIRSIRHALKNTDLFISGGGGLLQDVTSVRSLMYYCLLLVLARIERVPVMIYGQGIGPIRRTLSKILVRLALSGCDTIAVRDAESKALLQGIGVRRDIVVTADPALLLKPAQVSKLKDLHRPIVGFALRAWQGIDFDHMAGLADEISRKLGASIAFLPFHAKRDHSVAEQIAGRMDKKPVIVDDIDLPSEALGVVGELDTLIGMRLHSTIFAAIQGVPFIPIAYDPKVKGFSALVGAPEPVLCHNIGVDEIVSKLEDLLNSNGGSNYPLDDLRVKARQNTALAKQLLKERRILGIRFDALEMDEAAEVIEGYIAEGRPRLVVTLNAEMMVMAKNDQQFKSILMKADLLVPDSIGITWAGKLRARVPGIDMVEELAKRSAEKGYRMFMVGATEGVAEKAGVELARRYPGLKIAGAHSGYFSREQEKQILEEIKETRPDILLVGLGMGKQEKWIEKHFYYLNVPVSLGVGGSFDVVSGQVERAPFWVRRFGLEWLYRFVQQPTRYKRMLALPKFVYMVIRERGLI